MQLCTHTCCDSGASLFMDVSGIVNNPTLLAYLVILINLLVYTFDYELSSNFLIEAMGSNCVWVENTAKAATVAEKT